MLPGFEGSSLPRPLFSDLLREACLKASLPSSSACYRRLFGFYRPDHQPRLAALYDAYDLSHGRDQVFVSRFAQCGGREGFVGTSRK